MKEILGSNKKTSYKKLIAVMILIAFLGAIFLFSNQNGQKSNHISLQIVRILRGYIFPDSNKEYLKIVRNNHTLTGYYSYDGLDWKLLGKPIKDDFNREVYAGLFVTSNREGKLSSAVFDKVTILSAEKEIQQDGWYNHDIGDIIPQGSGEYKNNQYILSGAGTFTWLGISTSHYMYKKLSGDCTIIARVVSLEKRDEWSKAGIMIRDSLAPGSKFTEALVYPNEYISLQWKNEIEQKDKHTLKSDVVYNAIVRKALHFLGYLLLSFIVYSVVALFKARHPKRIIATLIFCIIFALSDEVHQIFVPGRSPQIRDVLIDSLGATLGLLILSVIKLMRSVTIKKRKTI